MSAPQLVKSGHEMKCGHSEPDIDRFSWTAEYPLQEERYVVVDLQKPNIVHVLQDNSKFLHSSKYHPFIYKWNYYNSDQKFTMVYDEGFEVRLKGNKFFGFSHFEPLKKGVNSSNLTLKTSENGTYYVTDCDKTVMGWYHNEDLSYWGCWKGMKLVEQEWKDLARKIDMKDNTKNQSVIQDGRNLKKSTLKKDSNDDLFDLSSNLSIKEDNQSEKNSIDNLFNEVKEKDEKKESKDIKDKEIQDLDNAINSLNSSQDTTSQEESTDSFLTLSSNFTDHEKVVEKLNSNATWNAKNYDIWSGKSISDLNKMAGRKSVDHSDLNIPVNQDVSDLPAQFNRWVEEGYVPEAIQQGNCGACYVIATTHMIESRLRIKYAQFKDNQVSLSIQHPLDCSFFNQGCDGGYPFLVSKFASEFEMVSSKCSRYRGHNWMCNTCKVEDEEYIYKVEDYGYIGGYYGASSEREMMLEIMNNGPVACSYEPPYDLFMYSSGVYKIHEQSDWRKKGMAKPEWTKVDHSNLCVGWGQTEEGDKYWIVQNTWGKDWGLHGYMWFKRGEDVAGIESITVYADPIILEKTPSGRYKKIEPDYNSKR